MRKWKSRDEITDKPWTYIPKVPAGYTRSRYDIISETPRSWSVYFGDHHHYIPKSQCHVHFDDKTIDIKNWLFNKIFESNDGIRKWRQKELLDHYGVL